MLNALLSQSSRGIMGLVICSLSLAACGGGDRDTPFNPGTGNSSNSSLLTGGQKITITRMLDKNNPALPFGEHKQIVVLRDDNEFYKYWQAYAPDEVYDSNLVDFEVGQVVLYDQGAINNCDANITFRTYSANDLSTNTARVIFDYRDMSKPSSNSSSEYSSSSLTSCANSSAGVIYNRVFRFYFVETRKTIMFEEKVNY